ncbi:MAG: 4-(cytidine 5'-diphospho)-2-C-methyl-D-erythritol kinase [Kiloniellales bacterium]
MTATAKPGGALRSSRRSLRRSQGRRAWAKVNLYLHVTGRRAGGYHTLDSLIVFAGIGDLLEAAPAPDLCLEVTGPFAGALEDTADADNLVMRAARGLRERFGRDGGARLRLEKVLPVAAGLGGGSADAAVALLSLCDLWDLHPAEGELAALGLELGADVPVCLAGRPSFVAGIGEEITAAPPLPPVWLVLVNPGLPLSTADVFAAREGDFSQPARWSGPIVEAAALAERLGAARNDLEPGARSLAPRIGEALAALQASTGCLIARLSGSGATCFGLYGNQASAEAAAATIARAQEGWWVQAAPVLTDAGPASG